MLRRTGATVLMIAAIASAASAQTKKPGTNSVTHDITVTADSVYTGTMEMAINRGKVTGNLRLTSPTEITGKVAGTVKAGVMSLEFPYYMTERSCEGTVKMNITLPEKPGPSKGTMEAVGCGRDQTNKVTGTVELKPVAAKSAK